MMSHGYDTFEKKRKWLVCGQLCFDVSFSGVVLLLDNQNRICFFCRKCTCVCECDVDKMEIRSIPQ